MTRIAPALLAVAVSLAVPAAAPAAERFAGVLEDGRLTTFTVPGQWALSTPLTPRGLAAGERLVALGTGPQGPVGIGSSARLYAVDPGTGAVTPIGPVFGQGLRGSRFSLAAAPNRATARLLSDVGQDLIVDLTTGATSDGPGLRRADTGATIRPAADLATDGRLVGAQLSPITLFTETAAGASAFTAAQADLTAGAFARPTEPIGVQVSSDGEAYLLAVASDFERQRQMVVLRLDPATGRSLGRRDRFSGLMSRRLTAFTSLGAAPPDKTPPRVRVRLGRSVSVRALLDDRLPLRIACAEACQISLSLELGGTTVGTGFALRDVPKTGAVDLVLVYSRARGRVRAAVGEQIRVVASIDDLKGNRRKVTRTARLAR